MGRSYAGRGASSSGAVERRVDSPKAVSQIGPMTVSSPHPPTEPDDAEARRAAAPVLVYPPGSLAVPDLAAYEKARAVAHETARLAVPPRDAACLRVPAGSTLRIECARGPQVGDLNLWNVHDFSERLFTGKTRALHGTHADVGDRLWSTLPFLRPLATLTADTLGWYGYDADGAGVHDLIGTRCDPYTHHVLSGEDYDRCCHSNLLRAFMAETGMAREAAEPLVHDVLNVFMCTGFTRDTHRYFMKASPVRPGDHIELFAEIDLLAGLSTCPGGDCGAGHSSDAAACHPLDMAVFTPPAEALGWWKPSKPSGYGGDHGLV